MPILINNQTNNGEQVEPVNGLAEQPSLIETTDNSLGTEVNQLTRRTVYINDFFVRLIYSTYWMILFKLMVAYSTWIMAIIAVTDFLCLHIFILLSFSALFPLAIPAMIALDKNGLNLTFTFERQDTTLSITSTATNSTSYNITNFVFKAAVPKVAKLHFILSQVFHVHIFRHFTSNYILQIVQLFQLITLANFVKR